MTKPVHPMHLEQLREIERRLSEAKGPNFALEEEIERILLPDDFARRQGNYSSDLVGAAARPYTASLDAAIALVERVLPGWHIARIGQHDDKTWHAELRRGYLTSYDKVALATEHKATPALALCLAIIRALIANPRPNETEI